MVFGGALAGILLPALLGLIAVAACDRRRVLGGPEQIALAYPLGSFLVTALLFCAGHWGWRFTIGNLLLLGAVPCTALAPLAFFWRKNTRQPPPAPLSPAAQPLSPVAQGLLLLLTAVTCAVVFAEVWYRPLGPPDSLTVWGLRAKVWADQGSLVLNHRSPFYLGGSTHPHYPPHISLLQAWTAIWMGGWNDRLVNLPWAAYYLSGLLLVYATLSRRIGRAWGVAAAFLLASTPLFATHAAIAGYADLMLSVHFAAAALAIYLWAAERRGVYLAIGLVFTISLPWIKMEGLPMAGVCAGALLLQARFLRRLGARWFLIAGIAAVALRYSRGDLRLYTLLWDTAFHADALAAVARSLFALGNWHFLWVLLAAVAAARLKRIWGTPLGWLLATLAGPAAGWFYLLSCTGAARFADNQTAAGRLFVSLAPTAVAWILLAMGGATQAAPEHNGGRSRAAGRRASGMNRRRTLTALGLVGIAALVWWLALLGRPIRDWTIPSPNWRLARQGSVLHYVGPPFDLRGSPGPAITTRPGMDTARTYIAWRQVEAEAETGRWIVLGRLDGWRFVDLQERDGWDGKLRGLALSSAPPVIAGIRRIEIARPGLPGALRRAWQAFAAPSVFGPWAINHLGSPHLGPLPVSAVIGALWLGLALGITIVYHRRAQCPWVAILRATLLLWVLCHALFLRDLTATAGLDRARFSAGTEVARTTNSMQFEFDELRSAVDRLLPDGASLLFYSESPLFREAAQFFFYPRVVSNWGRRGERSPYGLLFRLRAGKPPRYAALFWPPRGTYDTARKRLRIRPGKQRPVRPVAVINPHALLLELAD